MSLFYNIINSRWPVVGKRNLNGGAMGVEGIRFIHARDSVIRANARKNFLACRKFNVKGLAPIGRLTLCRLFLFANLERKFDGQRQHTAHGFSVFLRGNKFTKALHRVDGGIFQHVVDSLFLFGRVVIADHHYFP
jgi:hypothetical protein